MSNAQILNIPQFLGASYSGYKYYFYSAGTSTPKDVYKSSSGSGGSLHTNPVILNSNGSTTDFIWGTGFYKVILKTSDDTVVFTVDNVSGGEAVISSSGGVATSILDPSLNYIRNSGFKYYRGAATSAITIADAGDTAIGWYALSQTGNMTFNKQTLSGTVAANTGMRLINTSGGSQRMGVCQFIPVDETPPIIGNSIVGGISVKAATTGTMYIALLSGISTTDVGFTKDVVNSWTSPTYTEGNFFVSSAALDVVAVSSSSVTGGTWANLSVTGTVPASSTGLYLFVWTGGTVPNAETIDIYGAYITEGSTALTWRPTHAGEDYARCLEINQSPLTRISSVTCTSATSLTTDTYVKIPFNVEDVDIGGCYDAVTNFRYTADVAGWYLVTGRWEVADVPAGVRRINTALYKNGSSTQEQAVEISDTGATEIQGQNYSFFVFLNGTSDYLEIFVRVSGTSLALSTTAGRTQVNFVLIPGYDRSTST